MRNRKTDGRLGAALAAAALACAPAASAHVTASPSEAPAGGYALLQFSVGHGCEGSPTRRLRVRIPETVPSATPQVHPGWIVETKQGPKVPVELHGEEVTRGVSEIVWTAAEAGPLPDGRLDLFGASVLLPAGQAGDQVHFPAIQVCEQGRNRWIQVPQRGETADDLESPAPVVTLTVGEGRHGGHDAGGEAVEVENAATSAAADDGSSNGLAIAALILGALGLATGIGALVTARRRTA